MNLKKFIKYQHIILLVLLIAVAFMRNLQSIEGLSYGYDFDSERDLSNVHNFMQGNFGKDPSYLGEFMWYNPLITFVEIGAIKLTGISPICVVTNAGAFLNILCALSFYFMVLYLFNSSVAIAATASFLFFSTGNMPSWGAATYSPWFYPVNFMQTIFYLGIIFCFKSFIKPNNLKFLITGVIAGLTFLGHTAPALILLFIIGCLLLKEMFHSLVTDKSLTDVSKYIRYGLVFSIGFVLTSLPLTFFVIGKYHLKMVNSITYEYTEPLFALYRFPVLLKENISFSLIVALIGLYYLLFKFNSGIKKAVLLWWLIGCVILFAYTSFVPVARIKWNILLPGVVPAFHFFFYLKALQSVLFGLGLFYVIEWLIKKIITAKNKKYELKIENLPAYMLQLVLVLTLIYYPSYSNRKDFYTPRQYGLNKSKLTNEIEIYNWLLTDTHIDDVIVCDEDASSFPVLASGRKMVAVISTMSNPYINYKTRNEDRNIILSSLENNRMNDATDKLIKYRVNYILLKNKKITNQTLLTNFFGQPVMKNSKFTIYKTSIKNANQ